MDCQNRQNPSDQIRTLRDVEFWFPYSQNQHQALHTPHVSLIACNPLRILMRALFLSFLQNSECLVASSCLNCAHEMEHTTWDTLISNSIPLCGTNSIYSLNRVCGGKLLRCCKALGMECAKKMIAMRSS